MSSPELGSSRERCAVCPNRDRLSAILAKIGLAEVGTCPGPDIVDRFAVVAQQRQDLRQEPEAPAGFRYAGSQGDRTSTTDFFRTPADRTEVCPDDVIVIAEDEIVTKAQANAAGRLWVRIGTGEPDAVAGAEFDLDLDGKDEGRAMSPLEVLKAMRPQTVVAEAESQE